MDFLNTLKNMFSGGDTAKVLSENTGINADSIGKVINMALPRLVDAMTNNASSEEGAKSLFDALGQHTTDKSVEDQLHNVDTEDGNKIIGHILGDNKTSEIDTLAQDSDLSTGQISDLLSNVAPAILSKLSSAVSGASAGGGAATAGNGLLGLLSAFNK